MFGSAPNDLEAKALGTQVKMGDKLDKNSVFLARRSFSEGGSVVSVSRAKRVVK